MKNNKGTTLHFKIDDDYLIFHTLSSMSNDSFSSEKHKKDIVAFQNYAWKKCSSCYNLLVGRLLIRDVANGEIRKASKQLTGFLKELAGSRLYKVIYGQSEEYLRFCKAQWEKNYAVTSEIIHDLTELRMHKEFDVYITHPSLRNGKYGRNNVIEWGHNEDWSNYATVYLWHEVLHSYIGWSDTEHAVIELVTDEELRIRLNGGTYPPFIGHKHLRNVKRELLPQWKRYLISDKRNIQEFIKEELEKERA